MVFKKERESCKKKVPLVHLAILRASFFWIGNSKTPIKNFRARVEHGEKSNFHFRWKPRPEGHGKVNFYCFLYLIPGETWEKMWNHNMLHNIKKHNFWHGFHGSQLCWFGKKSIFRKVRKCPIMQALVTRQVQIQFLKLFCRESRTISEANWGLKSNFFVRKNNKNKFPFTCDILRTYFWYYISKMKKNTQQRTHKNTPTKNLLFVFWIIFIVITVIRKMRVGNNNSFSEHLHRFWDLLFLNHTLVLSNQSQQRNAMRTPNRRISTFAITLPACLSLFLDPNQSILSSYALHWSCILME